MNAHYEPFQATPLPNEADDIDFKMAKSIPFPDKNWELIEGRLNSFALISHCNLNPLWDLGVRKNQISGDLGDAPPQKKRSSARFLRRQLSHTYRPSTHFLRCTLHTIHTKEDVRNFAKYLHHSHHSHHPIFCYYSVLLSLFLTGVTTPRGMGEMKILNNAVLGVIGFVLSACEFSFKWYLTMCCLWSFLNTQSTSFSLLITTLHRFCLRRAQGWWI